MKTPEASFEALGLSHQLVGALQACHITSPFAIQEATIPDAVAGRDVLGRAPTGSGKTLAFGLPLLERLERSEPARSRRPRGLILSPTRELAEQIRRELEPLAASIDRSALAVYGGVGYGRQATALRRGVDLLVACPGRLQDLIDQGDVSLGDIAYMVVDEADRMADMGFLPAVRALLDLTPTDRQTLLFSATLDNDVQVLVKSYLRDPVTHEVGDLEPDLTSVSHRFVESSKESKIALAATVIHSEGPTMVFCRTRHGVDRVARQLRNAGVKAGWIHGGRNQKQRDAALQSFTTGRVRALVATDVAARGIHVDGVACVIHYDPPADPKDYVHRSGRTARAGAGGAVVSFVNRDQRTAVGRLQRQVGLPQQDPEPMEAMALESKPAARHAPKRSAANRSGAHQRSGSGSGSGSKHESKPKARSKPRSKTRSESKSRSESKPRSESRSDSNPRSESKPRSESRSTSESKPTSKSKPRGGQKRTPRHSSSSSGEKGASTERGAANRPASTSRPANGQKRRKAAKRSGRTRAKDHKQRRPRR